MHYVHISICRCHSLTVQFEVEQLQLEVTSTVEVPTSNKIFFEVQFQVDAHGHATFEEPAPLYRDGCIYDI